MVAVTPALAVEAPTALAVAAASWTSSEAPVPPMVAVTPVPAVEAPTALAVAAASWTSSEAPVPPTPVPVVAAPS